MNKKSKLAILGGQKTIKKKSPHFIWPPIDKKIERVVVKQLHDNISIYNRGGIFEEFENTFAKYHKRKHALLCNSGTTAIHSMYVAANLKKGDEIICPAYTFFATVTPLLFTGAKPVLCDCDNNGNIDPEEIKKKINSKTKGVVITHMWGIPCNMDKIVKICKENNLLLFEDCSHAHGAKFREKTVGSFGDLSAWSLQGAKIITGGEGGILTTNNDEFYYKALLLGHYNKRCKQEISKKHPLFKYSVTGMGLKYRAHPLAIVIAFEMFKNLNKYLSVKNKFAKKIIKEMKEIQGLSVPEIDFNIIKPFWYNFMFQYKQEELDNLPIEKFFDALQEEGLYETDRPGSTKPLNLLTLFQKPSTLFSDYEFSYKKGDFPKAEKFYGNAIKIPIWASDNDSDIIEKYISGIKKVVENYKDLL